MFHCTSTRASRLLLDKHRCLDLCACPTSADDLAGHATQEGADWTPQSLLSDTYRPPAAGEQSTGEVHSSTGQTDVRLSLTSNRASNSGLSTTTRNMGSMAASVPRRHRVLIGSQVSIVLKQDQPTGRQVQGTVAELLTRGDHPRGVKVRLSDGRVGRVQSVLEDKART